MFASLQRFSVALVFAAVVIGVLILDGCADPTFRLTRDIASGSCITATTGSLSVTSAQGGTVFAKQAETVVFCPPAIVANAASAPVAATALAK